MQRRKQAKNSSSNKSKLKSKIFNAIKLVLFIDVAAIFRGYQNVNLNEPVRLEIPDNLFVGALVHRYQISTELLLI